MAIYKTTDSDPSFRFVESVLKRDLVPYKMTLNAEGHGAAFEVDLDREQFHIVLKDAACEVQMKRQLLGGGLYVPVYSYETLTDPEKLGRLQNIYRAQDIEAGAERENLPLFPLESDSDRAEWLYAIPDMAWDGFAPLTERYVKAALWLADYELRHGSTVDDYEIACEIARLESPCPPHTGFSEDITEEDLEYIEELFNEMPE